MLSISVSIDDSGVLKQLDNILLRTKNLKPAMNIVGQVVRRSVIKNFQAGGRPERWTPSKRVKKQGGKTLIDTAVLQNSINSRPFKDRVEVGTNVVYAAIQQLGGTIERMQGFRKVKRSTAQAMIFGEGKTWRFAKGKKATHLQKIKTTIPARPFLMVQDEDWVEIRQVLSDYLTGLK
jgi:phage gpG-like protein